MSQRTGNYLYRLWDAERGPYGLLAVTMLIVFVVSPLVVAGVIGHSMVDVFFVVFMLVGVLTVRPGPAVRYLVQALVVLTVLTRLASKAIPDATMLIIEAVIDVLAISIFAALIMKQFLVSGRTAPHRIGAAILVYLLIGILWSRFYQIAGQMIPGSFQMQHGAATLTSYLYFSFVTLATIGYGDISPVHPVTRNLSILEAITGQMYIAVLIARLVSTSDANGGKKQ